MSVTATYESRCAECAGMIREGEVIVPADRGPFGRAFWQHETCPPGKLDIVREVCPVCFTERSVTGSCLCEAMP